MKFSVKDIFHRSAPASDYYSYDRNADNGPANWANVYPPGQSPTSSASCAGMQQSPVDIVTSNAVTFGYLPPITTNSNSTPELESAENLYQKIEVVINGNFPYVTGGALFSEKYYLKQWHYHIPSEHTINGESFDIEVHYVHLSDSGHYAVFGWFLNRGETIDPIIETILSVANQIPDDGNDVQVDIDVELPNVENYYYYPGSLTTPPCSETVDWFVFPTPLSLTSSQYNSFFNLFYENNYDTVNISNRPSQQLNGRVVTYVTSSGEKVAAGVFAVLCIVFFSLD